MPVNCYLMVAINAFSPNPAKLHLIARTGLSHIPWSTQIQPIRTTQSALCPPARKMKKQAPFHGCLSLQVVTCEPTCWKISPRLIGDERYSWAGPKLHVCRLPVVHTPVHVARDHISIAEDLLHHPHVSHAISPFYPGL